MAEMIHFYPSDFDVQLLTREFRNFGFNYLGETEQARRTISSFWFKEPKKKSKKLGVRGGH